MKIGIIGNGVVGSATAKCFEDKHEVRIYDLDPKLCTGHKILEVIGCDLVFVCLPTPQAIGCLDCDTDCVEHFFQEMASDGRERSANFVLRSTVPVGFTKRMAEKYKLRNLVHSPEFLTARTAVEDAKHPKRNVIGSKEGADQGSILDNLYRSTFPGIPTYHMTPDESEFVKLMQNAFSAVKIAFFNEMREFSDVKGMDWERMLRALLAGGWINPQHTSVPGPDGKSGYGGSCLPKDISNLVHCILEGNLRATMCQAAIERNKHDRSS